MTGFSTGPRHPLPRQVAKVIRERGLLQSGQKVLVAVSGGSDSVALLSILHELAPTWNLSLTAVHCNYGLRGAESDGDASFVTMLCRRFHLPCFVKTVAAGRRESGASSSLQARARDSRYRLFRELAAEVGAERVALGHTADDQAETVLLRMLRGAGLRGLAGMPHSRESFFVRPLLTVPRQELLSYLNAESLPYRTDSSNATSVYFRNRVRQELLPVLQSLNPAAIRLLARQADILREDDRLLDSLAAHRLGRIIHMRDPMTMVLDRAALLKQPAALQRRILRRTIQVLSPSSGAPRSDQLLSLLTSLASPRSGRTWRVGSVTVVCEPTQLRVTTASPPCAAVDGASGSEDSVSSSSCHELTILSFPWTAIWSLTGEQIHLRTVTRARGAALLKHRSPAIALFDAEHLSLPMRIRTWRPGDWFCPVGMEGRRKKLQDYFTDAKLGRFMRERMPLVLSKDSIAWVVGQRVDARFAATTSTTRFILALVTHPLSRKGAS